MMPWALAGPMPGRESSSAAVAVLTLIRPAAMSAVPAGAAEAASTVKARTAAVGVGKAAVSPEAGTADVSGGLAG